jgi:hypothetical protein
MPHHGHSGSEVRKLAHESAKGSCLSCIGLPGGTVGGEEDPGKRTMSARI